jgi:hypothetical protein
MPEGLQALEILFGPAVFALGQDLVPQEQGPRVGPLVASHAVEAFSESVAAVLAAGDFDIAITDEVL